MSNFPTSGPVPPESNPPIEPKNFVPSRFLIESITLGVTTLVTTSVDHDYVVGQEVRLLIPPQCQSRELNERLGFVISIPSSDQVRLNINSSMSNSFTQGSLTAEVVPQIIAVGDVNSGILSTTGSNIELTNIPGSFRNIS